ncbi:hypothetical protein LTR17_015332 [Elasticomyces elasticus]|nr:hypothetical protein LTR17_015332 [Elasticomyces elasticus]
MDMNQAKEPSPVATQTAPQPWDKSSRQLQSALAEFDYEMKVCTETSEKVRKRLSARNDALPSFAIDAEYAVLAEKVEAVMHNVVKTSTELLSEVKSFADRGTECPICKDPLDEESNEPGPVVQISPCTHQFHHNCLHHDVQARIINRIHTNALQQVARVTEFDDLTQKIGKFLSDFEKASSELLVKAEQFAEKGTQCTICSFALDKQPTVAPGSVMTVRQIDPCGHQFHAACLWEVFDEYKACPDCGGEVDADLEVQIGYNGTVDGDSHKGKGEAVGEDRDMKGTIA